MILFYGMEHKLNEFESLVWTQNSASELNDSLGNNEFKTHDSWLKLKINSSTELPCIRLLRITVESFGNWLILFPILSVLK